MENAELALAEGSRQSSKGALHYRCETVPESGEQRNSFALQSPTLLMYQKARLLAHFGATIRSSNAIILLILQALPLYQRVQIATELRSYRKITFRREKNFCL